MSYSVLRAHCPDAVSLPPRDHVSPEAQRLTGEGLWLIPEGSRVVRAVESAACSCLDSRLSAGPSFKSSTLNLMLAASMRLLTHDTSAIH